MLDTISDLYYTVDVKNPLNSFIRGGSDNDTVITR